MIICQQFLQSAEIKPTVPNLWMASHFVLQIIISSVIKSLFNVLHPPSKKQNEFTVHVISPGFLGTPAGIATTSHPSSAPFNSSGPWWLVT